jgi:hypothetical protein
MDATDRSSDAQVQPHFSDGGSGNADFISLQTGESMTELFFDQDPCADAKTPSCRFELPQRGASRVAASTA